MTLGTKIRSLRNLKGLSREQLAEKLNISLTAYSKIERDETDVNYSRLESIAQALEVSVQELMSFGEKVFIYANNNNTGSSGNGIVSYSPDIKDVLIEVERLKTERTGLLTEITHLKTIIKLLETK